MAPPRKAPLGPATLSGADALQWAKTRGVRRACPPLLQLSCKVILRASCTLQPMCSRMGETLTMVMIRCMHCWQVLL